MNTSLKNSNEPPLIHKAFALLPYILSEERERLPRGNGEPENPFPKEPPVIII